MNANLNSPYNKKDDKIPTKKKRGRPKKSEVGIAKPSTKKRGRPKKNVSEPPKPVGRRGRPRKEDLSFNAFTYEEPEENIITKAQPLTSKEMEAKLKREKRKQQSFNNVYFSQEEDFGKPRNKSILSVKNMILIGLICVFAISTYAVSKHYYNISNTEKKYESIASKVILVGKKDDTAESNFDTVNFQDLKSINADAVAWIKIENTTINYPVMQTTDNNYYLSNDIYRKEDKCGSIYMDFQNDKRVVDKNTVIYGHNIKNGIMFNNLEKILSGDMGKDIDIYIYTPEKSMKFKVFSSYMTEPDEYPINTEVTEKQYDEFVDILKNKSSKEFVGKPDKSNQIITLSTCDKSGKQRIVVHAELEDIE